MYVCMYLCMYTDEKYMIGEYDFDLDFDTYHTQRTDYIAVYITRYIRHGMNERLMKVLIKSRPY